MASRAGRAGRRWRKAVEVVKKRSQVCELCGEAIDMDLQFPDPMSFSVDHIIPLSELEEDDPRRADPDWLQSTHLKCNSSRQNMSMAEWRVKQDAAEEFTRSWSRQWI
ncbi:HNH endonuclease signature motif containing protein [Corynebacterium accolens]|uniref:HNH endonuclease signature motif containing protein n=1 Tax=Corynebacterium accolens TaxID=38284 RepID=UPI0026702D1E|nr:HNH endonuclease [Corynebacterium accolens]WKS54925.1 HNH endonuclease [Corynebacterium accolens]